VESWAATACRDAVNQVAGMAAKMFFDVDRTKHILKGKISSGY